MVLVARPVAPLICLLFVCLFVSPSLAGPLDDITIEMARPAADFSFADGRAVISWTVLDPTNGAVWANPDLYRVYRVDVVQANPGYTYEEHDVGFELYHDGPQTYSHVDTTYDPMVPSVYYVRPVDVRDGVESAGQPSNPVSGYPRCTPIHLFILPPTPPYYMIVEPCILPPPV